MNIIVTCACNDTDSFAKDAFKIICPGEDLPLVMTGEEALELYETDDITQQQIAALTQAKEKYAYLFKDGGVWDLLKGTRVA